MIYYFIKLLLRFETKVLSIFIISFSSTQFAYTVMDYNDDRLLCEIYYHALNPLDITQGKGK